MPLVRPRFALDHRGTARDWIATVTGSDASNRGHDVALTQRQFRIAEALQVERMHGDAAPRFVAERIGALALAGDEAGVARWKAIAFELDALTRGSQQ